MRVDRDRAARKGDLAAKRPQIHHAPDSGLRGGGAGRCKQRCERGQSDADSEIARIPASAQRSQPRCHSPSVAANLQEEKHSRTLAQYLAPWTWGKALG